MRLYLVGKKACIGVNVIFWELEILVLSVKVFYNLSLSWRLMIGDLFLQIPDIEGSHTSMWSKEGHSIILIRGTFRSEKWLYFHVQIDWESKNPLIYLICLQVIEYVQYLQEKVQKYEGSYQGWSQEPSKLMPWVN